MMTCQAPNSEILTSASKSSQNLAGEVFIFKHPMNSEASGLLRYARNFTDTLDSQLFVATIWGWKQDLNPNVRSNWWAFAAEDQCPIQCDVVREPPFGTFCPVIPVENNWQAQSVSDGSPSLRSVFLNRIEAHA
jgi:hypothetical protein